MREKRGQVTLFIIIAIILVGAIFLYFALSGRLERVLVGVEINPQEYVEKCTKDASEQAINILLPQGGYIEPENYKLFEDSKASYLCYNKGYYYSCINQEPMYIERVEQEIKNYIEPRVKDCFYALEQEYKDRNYAVESGEESISVNLNPKQVGVEIKKKFDISKGEEARSFDEFKVRFNSPVYDLAIIAIEIVNQEARFCNFEYLGYSLLYPSYNIERTDVDGGTRIYSVEEKISGKKLIFAVRSCAMPAGL